METTKFCSNCGEKIDAKAEICTECGVRVRVVTKKSTGLAAILSFIFPGLGQLYNGEIGKGIFFIALAVFSFMMIILFIGWIMMPIVWFAGIYDAYKSAERISSPAI